MGEKTDIAWADSTFNPWIGCQKVSAGCDNCYAEALMDKRWGKVQWGPHGERKRTSAANWKQPMRWDKKARHAQEDFMDGMLTRRPLRPRVFCSSLADVFDNQVPEHWRIDLFDMIARTEHLDWLLLTKRPENIAKMLPTNWGTDWSNVWLGTTCEDQAAYDRRWPILSAIPAAVRFISYEPAIGPLSILGHEAKPDWLICGGESGPGFRHMDAYWEHAVRRDCQKYGVAYFLKQWHGKQPFPASLEVIRQFPVAA